MISFTVLVLHVLPLPRVRIDPVMLGFESRCAIHCATVINTSNNQKMLTLFYKLFISDVRNDGTYHYKRILQYYIGCLAPVSPDSTSLSGWI